MPWRPGELAVGGEGRDGYRQIVGGSLLAHVGGAEVDGHLAAGPSCAALRHGCLHALVALLDGRVGKSDHAERESLFDDGLDGDHYRVDALYGGSVGLDEHIRGEFRALMA